MKALILAAGKGSRLGNMTLDRPKAMVNVSGRPLIDYVLDFLAHREVKEIGIVGGYKFEVLTSYLRTYALTHLRTYFNPNYNEGSIRTVMTACDFLDDDFLLMNADHIYPKRMLPSLLAQRHGITAMCDYDRNLTGDDMKIKKGKDGYLIKIRKDLADYDGGYIGMTYIPKTKLGAYKEAMADSYKIYGASSNVEAILGHMASSGHQISIADLGGQGWLEVDTPEDLKGAEARITKGL